MSDSTYRKEYPMWKHHCLYSANMDLRYLLKEPLGEYSENQNRL